MDLESLSKEQLIRLLKAFSKNWLTTDGLWFTGVEDKFGLEAAVELDLRMWQRYAQTEARRVKEALGLEVHGPTGVARATGLMTCIAGFDAYVIEEKGPDHVVVTWPHCRIQETRVSQGRGAFPCKPMGIAMFEGYIRVLDPRVRVACVFCPPDPHPDDAWCQWKLSL